MVKFKDKNYKELIEKIYDQRQEHVFAWWDELNYHLRKRLLDQLNIYDFDLICHLKKKLEQDIVPKADKHVEMKPPSIIQIPKTKDQIAAAEKAKKIGEEAIRSGRTAAFLVSGGQGTRLGFHGPKGTFTIGPVTGKSLFQIHAEKILSASRNYNVTIPWYIMTSQINDEETKEFFKDNKYFDLGRENIYFFTQKMIPAMNNKGQFILDRKDHISESPNGHGGSLLALYERGALNNMKERGVEYISYFQVDNVLVTIIDPVFIGYHIKEKAEMSSKMVQKKDPDEKVGVFGMVNGRLKVIEYSDISRDDKEACYANGRLKYSAGSIAIHLINVDFVYEEVEKEFKLPYHTAYKKIPYLNSKGETVSPDNPNGYKFETFVFDALSDTTSSVIMEVLREHEFSPVKNSKGDSSPESAKRDMANYFGGWLEKAGISIPRDKEGNVKGSIEISPLYSESMEEFLKKVNRDIEYQDSLYIG